jgi:hypothetical protein
MTAIDRTAIEKIEELVTHSLEEATVHGIPYDRKTWKPIDEPSHETLMVKTLQAFADYVLHAAPPSFTWVVHIVDPTKVRLVSNTENPTKQRNVLLTADAIIPPQGKFGAWMPQDEFSIWLQTTFVQTVALEELLKLAGNVKAQAISVSTDDGVSQEATVQRGIATVEREGVKPKWELSAWRSFNEVPQSSGWYLFRLAQAPSNAIHMSLHPVIDASWALKAMKEIRTFLGERLKGYTVLA